MKYEDRSYHQLRRLCRTASGEERQRLSAVIANYYKNFIQEAIRRQHVDWSEAEQMAAVIERMYRDDFSADEMERIKASILAFHDRHSA